MRAHSDCRRLGLIAALAALLMAAWSMHASCAFAQTKIAVGETADFDIKFELSDEKIRWGEEFRVTATATNIGTTAQSGGFYLSFDSDVVVLEVQGGVVLRPGASVFDLKTLQLKTITRPMIEVWDESWKAGESRKMTALVAPLVGRSIRLLARVTLVPDRTHVVTFPSRMQSKSLDEAGFPTRVDYLDVLPSSLRRAVRRLEARIRLMQESEQRRFAAALAAELDNPKGFLTSSGAGGSNPSLMTFLPNVKEQLRKDPLAALENLRCLMVNIECQRAAVYFGLPAALYKEMSDAEKSQLEAKRLLGEERGGTELVALLEGEGITVSLLPPGGQISLEIDGKTSSVAVTPRLVQQVLDTAIEGLGERAKKPIGAANGLSFEDLRKQISGALGPPGRPKQ